MSKNALISSTYQRACLGNTENEWGSVLELFSVWNRRLPHDTRHSCSLPIQTEVYSSAATLLFNGAGVTSWPKRCCIVRFKMQVSASAVLSLCVGSRFTWSELASDVASPLFHHKALKAPLASRLPD